MNHPKPEEWIPYLFGEAPPDTRASLRLHLQSCPECQAQIQGWKRSLNHLDRWRLPRAARTQPAFSPVFKWAVAGAGTLVLLAAFLLGRLTSPATDVAKLRTAIAAQVSAELRQELTQTIKAETAKAAAATVETANQQTTALLADYDASVERRLAAEKAERVADCVALKRDVDTLAVNADAGLRNTQQRLTQLAAYH